MRKFTIAAIAVLSVAGSGAVYAQYHRPWMERFHHMRMNPEDRAAFIDARIAAVHAGLKLNADQEKLWPPVEAAVRDFAKLRIDRANARMNAGPGDTDRPEDPIARLRQRAEDMGASSAALKKIADAADPLYKTLDEGQKRRLAVLTRHRGPFGGGEDGLPRHFMEHRMDRMMERGMGHFHRDRFDRDGGPDGDREGRL
ncbi:Spy/CpxP family protein refolding chaperone [Bradyrhizobium sp. 147]|uniref:Spy/CpxP family protein refolding chaperone n=1 Tax=unclassified Bradyrhizobium TaxID=2631580 RepID=UPI001FFA2AA8|nr:MULTISPECIES: Spy/CpxP family protein refolding chaperone [unclassified Bradyrhizobium]MCK1422193.1 Spy/CpxP family protein refolding chaperone [Bradyrhizobium sp. CW12]MCK1492817.1 Spy/CpxP family protein refolding chaperone [Bradyrhizobium sp. 180]MCK1528944.1 Spy/CpxP family protein refolding chaperone [Bradyrhizobium sp. 182]MCK1597976.1 Spy/CpxP family protein refolding chaperone [Bradyrhizobium sp. 164]MCK1615177.1 Spy/CpxP family protein refolding chaperone [Bradyrhizobium sp. 159]